MKTIIIPKKLGEDLNIIIREEETVRDVLNIPANCRYISDNDFGRDSPDLYLKFWLDHQNKLDVTYIQTFNPHTEWPPSRIATQWEYVYTKAAGMKITPLIQGSAKKMVPPAGGKIEDTVKLNSAGADIIISQALASEHLLIDVGGNLTTVAHAYLKNPAIANKITILHTNGLYRPYDGSAQGYNTQDHWAAYICAKRMNYVSVNFKGVPAYWYTGKDLGFTRAQALVLVKALPKTPMTELLYEFFDKHFEREGMADALPILSYLNRSLWTSTEQRKLDNETTFTFVNGHNWNQYGPTLINQFK